MDVYAYPQAQMTAKIAQDMPDILWPHLGSTWNAKKPKTIGHYTPK